MGGPLDGSEALIAGERHPFAVSINTDTDGFYVIEHQVAGQRLGALERTQDDVIARWHQRSSPTDFTNGDAVIVKATGQQGMLLAQQISVHEDGTSDEGWLTEIGPDRKWFPADELRIATADELGDNG